MKKKLLIFISLGTLLFPLIVIVIAVGALAGAGDSASSSGSSETVEGVTYVEHWSTDNAYTHNLLAHRYGIKADQIDGFLNSTGIKYDKSRINGKKVLEWEKTSGLDARAIVAIAEMESSLGTAGVATQKGANMFGYGAYDSNPDNASNFNDESAVTGLTKTTIIQNKNESFKIQDDKAKKNANGSLNTSKDGGVYFTDTSGTGKKRAEVMEKMDKWIDDHGGTPKPPKDSGSKSHDGGGVTSAGVPSGYSLTKKIDTSGYDASTYPWGQCTWFVYNRAKEVGVSYDPYMGNGGAWKSKAGYKTTHTPTEHSAISFAPGEAGADPSYGHVAFVEQVKKDGSILISESNGTGGLGSVSYRTFDKATASTFTYVIGK